jgi:hypothetical protein
LTLENEAKEGRVSLSLGMQRDNAMQARWEKEVRNQKNVEQLF